MPSTPELLIARKTWGKGKPPGRRKGSRSARNSFCSYSDWNYWKASGSEFYENLPNSFPAKSLSSRRIHRNVHRIPQKTQVSQVNQHFSLLDPGCFSGSIRILLVGRSHVVPHLVYCHCPNAAKRWRSSTQGRAAECSDSYSITMICQGVVVISGKSYCSMDGFKGKFPGNHRFSHEIWGFSCKFSLKPIHWIVE